MDYKGKYAKYKAKYLHLKNDIEINVQKGGGDLDKVQRGGNFTDVGNFMMALNNSAPIDGPKRDQIAHIFGQLVPIDALINQFFDNVIAPNLSKNIVIVDSQNMARYESPEFNYDQQDGILQNILHRANSTPAEVNIIKEYIDHQIGLKKVFMTSDENGVHWVSSTYAAQLTPEDKLVSVINMCTVFRKLTDPSDDPIFIIVHRTTGTTSSLVLARENTYILSIAYNDRALNEVDDLLCVILLHSILQKTQAAGFDNVSIMSRDAYSWINNFTDPNIIAVVNTHRTIFEFNRSDRYGKLLHHAPEHHRQQIMRFQRI
jgi:hypothetical protein